MLMIPHSTALDLDGHAYMTYAVAILCIIIFYFQCNNEQEVQLAMGSYCESIYSLRLDDKSVDVMRTDVRHCRNFLEMFHTDVDFLIPQQLEYMMWDKFYFYNAQMDKVLELMQGHYQAFQKNAPDSLNASLMYYPGFPNPIKMITSSLSHGSVSHIVGNLIFFLAFAPALELLIGNLLKYLGVMLIIAFSTSVSYSLVMLISGSNAIPTLGLSGVVMGMIGLSAYMMPKAKIRVFVWWFTFARNFYISAWILAVWYIGWDAWNLLTTSDHGGVNLIAHVSGGVTGYLIGFYWLKETREDTRDDLDDEIEYQRSKRADRHTTPGISFSGNRKYIEGKQQQRQFEKDHAEYMGRLYQYVQCGNDSNAIVLILDDYEFQSFCVENYEELFQRITEWGDSRTALCMGRVCISLLVEQRKYKRAMDIFNRCYKISDSFVLADAAEVLLLAWGMIELHQYESARNLIHKAGQRYGEYIDAARCQLLEIELLMQHLDQPEEAHSIMNILLLEPDNPYKKEVLSLAKVMQSSM